MNLLKKLLLFVLLFNTFVCSANLTLEQKNTIQNAVDRYFNSLTKISSFRNELKLLKEKYEWDSYKIEVLAEFDSSLVKRYSQIVEWIKTRLKESSKINKVLLWYSSGWSEIYAYYKWDITKPFFWVFSNIHWGYEYWTYLTAQELIEKFNESWKKQWFVIPTINPDGLQIAIDNNFEKSYYLNWRINSSGVDLNRSFCTYDFSYNEYVKKNQNFVSATVCNSQKETQIIKDVLEKYSFSEIISLHSAWKIFYLPDNSFYDKKIIALALKLKKILPDYMYYSPSNNEEQNKKIIKALEVNEWNFQDLKYTWMMENYIYHNFWIPVVLIEFTNHWVVEERLLNLINYLN